MKQIVHRFHDKPWKHGLLAAICLALSYAAVSWALDSGRLTAYFLCVVFFLLGIRQIVRGVKMELRLRTR